MRYYLAPILLFFIVGCSNPSAPIQTEDIIQVKADLEPSSEDSTLTLEIQDSVVPVRIDTFNIEDYYDYFEPTQSLRSIRVDFDVAYKNKSFRLGEVDYDNGYISYYTQNTPPGMDGDSETEYEYVICYWVLPNGNRFIARTTNEITWVSEQTMDTYFYLHDSSGINLATLDGWSWDLGSYIKDKALKSIFSSETWEHPQVFVHLPKEGKSIKVRLVRDEFIDDWAAYRIFDSLNIQPEPLVFNPLDQF